MGVVKTSFSDEELLWGACALQNHLGQRSNLVPLDLTSLAFSSCFYMFADGFMHIPRNRDYSTNGNEINMVKKVDIGDEYAIYNPDRRMTILSCTLVDAIKASSAIKGHSASVLHTDSILNDMMAQEPELLPFEDDLDKTVTDCPVIPFGEYMYFIHPLSDAVPKIDAPLLRESVIRLFGLVDNADALVTAMTMGLPLAAPMAMLGEVPLSIAQKEDPKGKRVCVKQTTGYSQSNLYLKNIEKGSRVVIVDDVLSTTGTLRAMEEAIDQLGCELVSAVFLFNKYRQTKELEEELGISIRSLYNVEVKDGKLVRL